MPKRLDGFTLKMIALLSMTCDHLGVFFFLGPEWRIIGRLAFPLFAFLLVEGFYHTRNRQKYFLTIAGAGLLMQLPLYLMGEHTFNIFLTLALGLIALQLLSYRNHLSVALLLFVAWFLPFDYGMYGLLLILGFYLFKVKPSLLIGYTIIVTGLSLTIDHLSVLQLYSLFALPLLLMYNGQRGKNWKWFFYLYYPLHIIVINALALILFSNQ
ncbi:TraX family protein [Brochothrix campestris]|uniref:TraX family protein n=1 Tax=Brochothrix campestris FSL F6-1037 TaxID=1265861 RepID=W7D961_9LIST|nr:TraX family protein [Brochothrix campestris]EUJ41773.1 TraX family protein [Brochothrix campestris FSL F6-1037]